MEKVFEGKTEQEAIELAAKEFGVSREYMDVEVIKKSKKGIFGLNSKVVIKVSVEGLPQGDDDEGSFSEATKSHHKRAPAREIEEEIEEPLSDEMKEVAKETIISIVDKMGIKIHDVIFTEDSSYVEIEIKEEDQNILIGRFGKNIEALQLLVNAVLQSKIKNAVRVVLDIEKYRKKRNEWLQSIASTKAEYVLRSGKSFLMDTFGPYDRRQIHTAVRPIDGVETESEGDGYLKRVRIFLA